MSRAILRNVRVAPRKARLVANLVRGRDVPEAIEMLSFTQKKSAPILRKLIESAVANAEHNDDVSDLDGMFIEVVTVDEGPRLRRWRPRAQGRATRILKKTSHITVILGQR